MIESINLNGDFLFLRRSGARMTRNLRRGNSCPQLVEGFIGADLFCSSTTKPSDAPDNPNPSQKKLFQQFKSMAPSIV
jgi:hypothetical protein